jgi:hypothetical protein
MAKSGGAGSTGNAPPGRAPVSIPLATFWSDVLRATLFFSTLSDILRSTDKLANAVAEVRLEVLEPGDPRRIAFEEALQRPDRRQEWFKAQQDLVVELLVVRVVDGFLTYLAQTLALVFRARPEMLRSEEQVRVDEVLRFDTMEELIAHLAERRVSSLAYKSLAELSDYLHRQLGFEMFTSDEDLSRASALVELRNLIVHNGRVVNARYLARVPGFQGTIGSKVPVDADTLEEAAFLTEVASRIDEQAAAKWGLARDAALPADAPKGQHRRGA